MFNGCENWRCTPTPPQVEATEKEPALFKPLVVVWDWHKLGLRVNVLFGVGESDRIGMEVILVTAGRPSCMAPATGKACVLLELPSVRPPTTDACWPRSVEPARAGSKPALGTPGVVMGVPRAGERLRHMWIG